MTVSDMLRDAQAAYHARLAYQRAAERHAERALRKQDAGERAQARLLARFALLCQDEAAYDGVVSDRLSRYVG